jgi:hypothetical protein
LDKASPDWYIAASTLVSRSEANHVAGGEIGR